MELLSKYTNIDTSTLKAIDKLRNMRNEVVHNKIPFNALTTNDAIEYSKLADKMTKRLNQLQSVGI